MVATIHKSPPTFAVSPMVQRMGFGAVAFTIDDMLTMVKQRLLPEDSTIELLDGAIIYRDRFDLKGGEIVPGVQHDFVVDALADLNDAIKNGHRYLRVEKTLVCRPDHAPIPDACIVRGTPRDYAGRYPAPADAWCVIEVADSSYERDAGEKLIGYARAGVGQYIIINLRNRTAEVYTAPAPESGTFAETAIISAEGQLGLRVGPDQWLRVSLKNLLP